MKINNQGLCSMFKDWFVRRIYADHNDSSRVRAAVKRCTESLNGGKGLNIGSGSSWHNASFTNLDLRLGPFVNCVGDAEALPFTDDSFALVVTQETLEHVGNPEKAMKEIYRVTQPGGLLYCQLPFVIGYHPGPSDFWRFTRDGIQRLVERHGFNCEEVSISVGPAVGFYRIATEFWASIFASFSTKLYKPAKGTFALLFYPIKWLDRFLLQSPEAHRIPGGYYVFASKPRGGPLQRGRMGTASEIGNLCL
jgi:SAM-dependent methyltransferase